MSRLPLRVRLAASAAAALALVLAVLGVFVYSEVGDALRSQVDEALENRAEVLARSLREGRTPAVAGDEEDFAQVLARDGTLLAGTPGVRLPELEPAQLAAAGAGPLLLDTVVVVPDEGEREPGRVLVAPVGDRLVLVGASLEDREDALSGLLGALLVAAPLAAAAAGGAGYVLAGAALRPVEAMRRRAAQVTAATPGERLPLPAARDELRRLGATLNEISIGSTTGCCENAGSSPTRATSCAPRWPRCRSSSSSRCGARVQSRSSRRHCTPRPRTCSGSSRSRRTCSCSPPPRAARRCGAGGCRRGRSSRGRRRGRPDVPGSSGGRCVSAR